MQAGLGYLRSATRHYAVHELTLLGHDLTQIGSLRTTNVPRSQS